MRHRTVTYLPQETFAALADPTRRALLDLLRQASLAAGHIARSFPISRPAISRHLRLLRRARLVRERREGRHRIYQLNAEPLQAVDRWLDPYREFWCAQLSDLKAYLEGESGKQISGARAKTKSNRGKQS
ncbi:MAG TPA: metalloregulator ArsR/SmtB family transcription factor [Terriglobia bacterium]|nr:metalloregulator ArsR/SmtB family transcription factor [Terriglobia bacterium]